MFSKVAFVATLFAVLAVASADNNQCSTGTQQCCNQVHQADSAEAVSLKGLMGVVGNVVGAVGMNCSPILGGNSCTQQPVCCTNNSFNGLIAMGCSPVNLNA